MALFDKKILSRELTEFQRVNANELQTYWQVFQSHFLDPVKQKHIKSLNEKQYQGGFLKDLFCDCLGYTLKPSSDYNLIQEVKNAKGAKTADGAIKIESIVRAVIELKDTKTKNLDNVENQAFGYKVNHSDCPYVIISNFEKLRFYIQNTLNYEEFNLFTLTKDEFDLLYYLLSYKQIKGDIPLKLKVKSGVSKREEDVSNQLYKDYSFFLSELFEDLKQNNPQITDLVWLFRKCQKLLDRLLFIFFAEDKFLLPNDTTSSIIIGGFESGETETLYERLKQCFRWIDRGNGGKGIYGYNGGLFREDIGLNDLLISNEVLKRNMETISNYDFNSEVDVNILGHIFENSIGEIEAIKKQLTEGATNISLRKSNGVFYTPKYITAYMVEQTLGKLCSDKKRNLGITAINFQEIREIAKSRKAKDKERLAEVKEQLEAYRAWLKGLTICDPACGSGAFLIAVLDFLIKEHRLVDELKADMYGDSLVFEEVERDILEHNIYGVDIMEEAVEIAKLGLWLHTAKPKRKLSSLSDNLKAGNSLVGFDWEKEFPKVFKEGGFDVIIGNPPYVKEATHKEAFDNLKDNECYQGKMDLWYFFGNLALDIVKKEEGLITYIAPNNWTTNAGASKFRNLVLEKGEVLNYVDFGNFKVFKDAGIQTMIYLMKASQKEQKWNVIYSKLLDDKANVEEVMSFLEGDISDKSCTIEVSIDRSKQKDKMIYFTNKNIDILLNRIKTQQNFVLDNKEFYSGIDIGQDFINKKSQKILGNSFKVGDGIFNLSDEEKKAYNFSQKELSLIKPFYTTAELGKYYGNQKNHLWVIYTDSSYKNPNSLDLHPNIKSHLDKFQSVITSANKPYGLHRAREEKGFWGEKILSLRKCNKEPTFTYTDFDCYVNRTFNIIKTDRLNLKYLVALLNSKLVKFWLKYRGKMQGNNYQVDKEPLLSIPIKTTDDKSIEKNLISLVDKVLSLEGQRIALIENTTTYFEVKLSSTSSKLSKWTDLEMSKLLELINASPKKLSCNQEQELLEHIAQQQDKEQKLREQVLSLEEQINKLVYALYGLNKEDIAVIEQSI